MNGSIHTHQPTWILLHDPFDKFPYLAAILHIIHPTAFSSTLTSHSLPPTSRLPVLCFKASAFPGLPKPIDATRDVDGDNVSSG